jgi:hypothetical protein
MIEFRKSSDDKYKLFIDGSPVNATKAELVHSQLHPPGGSEDRFSIILKDNETVEKLTSHAFSELPRSTLEIKYRCNFDWFESVDNILIETDQTNESYTIYLNVDGGKEWRHVYGFAEYHEELLKVARAASSSDVVVSILDFDPLVDAVILKYLSLFSVICRPASPSLPIGDEVARFSNLLHEFHQEATRRLYSRIRSDSVVMYFDFSDEVRVPCEQYLLYFVQFLKDLGVEATAEIQHEAGQVLFAVTPTNKDDALDKIYSALRTYLQLASSPITDDSEPESEIAVQRLLANIDHLKSQLRLSYMMVRTQEATIQAQQATITYQQRILSGEIIIDSIRDVTPRLKAEEKEEFLGGTLAIIPLKGKGFEVNLPEVFRKLKRLFTEKE